MMSPPQLRNFIETSEARIKEIAAAKEKEEAAKEARLAIKSLKEEWNKSTTYSNYANVCVKMKEKWGNKECKESLTIDCWNANTAEELVESVNACFDSLTGTSSNTGCQHDNIPLLKAVCDQNYSEVKKLLQNGADVSSTNNNGENALHLAVKTKNDAIATLLFKDFNVNVNSPDNNGTNPLMLAVVSGNLTLINTMDRYSSFVNYEYRNKAYQTPLHLALENNHQDIAIYLLNKDVNVRVDDNEGNTPLHLAAQKNNYAIVRTLVLDKNVDVNAKNDDGKTPIDLTTNNSVKRLLEEYK